MSQQGTIVMEGTFDEYNLQELLEVTSLCRQLIQVTLFNATIPQGLILMKAGKVLDVKLGNGEKGLLAFARLLNHTFEAFKVLKFKSKGLNLPNPIGSLIDLLDPTPSDTVRFSLPKEGFSSDIQEEEELAELDLVETLNTKAPVSKAEDDKQNTVEANLAPPKKITNDHSEKIEQSSQKVAKSPMTKGPVSHNFGTNPFKPVKPLSSPASKPLFPEKSLTPQSQDTSIMGPNPLSEEVHKVVLESHQEISSLGQTLQVIQQEFETLQRDIQQIQVIHSGIKQLHHQQEGYQQINHTLPQIYTAK